MKFKIFAGQISAKLAKKVAKELGQKLGNIEFKKFSDGEIWLRYKEDIRGKALFIIQSFSPPAENLLELLLMIDAAKRNSAKRIFVVVPYFGYARQDKKDQLGAPVSAGLMADLISAAGANRILTIDIHSDRVLKFFKSPVKNLSSAPIFLEYIKKNLPGLPQGFIILAPDAGSVQIARDFSRGLGNCGIAVIDKERLKTGKVKIRKISGKIKNKSVLLVDDIFDTGSTLIAAANTAKKMGAKKIYACVTHGIFSGNAIEKINKSPISKLFITDTIPLPLEKRSKKIKIISAAPLLSKAIPKILKNR
jgi:ribose-phosphate pyrophosphokinase